MQVTQWFSHTEPPVHIGVYEVRSFDGSNEPSGFARWDGKNWSYIGFFGSMDSREKCFEFAKNSNDTHVSGFIESWRGIATDEPAFNSLVVLPVSVINNDGVVIFNKTFKVQNGDMLTINLIPAREGIEE